MMTQKNAQTEAQAHAHADILPRKPGPKPVAPARVVELVMRAYRAGAPLLDPVYPSSAFVVVAGELNLSPSRVKAIYYQETSPRAAHSVFNRRAMSRNNGKLLGAANGKARAWFEAFAEEAGLSATQVCALIIEVLDFEGTLYINWRHYGGAGMRETAHRAWIQCGGAVVIHYANGAAQ